MVPGAGIGGWATAVLPLVGLVSILLARRKRKGGRDTPIDQALEDRRAATLETERRMAAYLAQRRSDDY